MTDKEKTLNVLNIPENRLPNTTFVSGGQRQKVGENSTRKTELSPTNTTLQTVQIAGNNSTSSQRDANYSMSKIAGEMNKKPELGDQTSSKSLQNSNFFHNKNATSQQSELKPNGSDNSVNQVGPNAFSTSAPQSSYTDIYRESPPLGDTTMTPNAFNLTLSHNNVETLKSNISNTSNADHLTEIVNSSNGSITLKSVKNSPNISEATQSTVDNGTDVVSIIMPEQSENTINTTNVQSSISDGMVPTNTSHIRQAGILNTSGTETSTSEVVLGMDSSLPISGGSETVGKLDRQLNALQNSDKDRGKQGQKIQRFRVSSARNDSKIDKQCLCTLDIALSGLNCSS